MHLTNIRAGILAVSYGKLAKSVVIAGTALVTAAMPAVADNPLAASNAAAQLVVDGAVAVIATPAHELTSSAATAVVFIRPLDVGALDATAFGDWEYAAIPQPTSTSFRP